MARAYFDDARHFRERGELEKALANVNYAHGWLDAGARIGLFEVGGDDKPFPLRGKSDPTSPFVFDPPPLQGPKLQNKVGGLSPAPGPTPEIPRHGHHPPPHHSPVP